MIEKISTSLELTAGRGLQPSRTLDKFLNHIIRQMLRTGWIPVRQRLSLEITLSVKYCEQVRLTQRYKITWKSVGAALAAKNAAKAAPTKIKTLKLFYFHC